MPIERDAILGRDTLVPLLRRDSGKDGDEQHWSLARTASAGDIDSNAPVPKSTSSTLVEGCFHIRYLYEPCALR